MAAVMVNLPEDVMLEICVRLPVQSVGRFRCVNKSWYKLLNGRKFIQKHLDHATEMNRLRFMINSWNNQIYAIDYDPSLSTCDVSVNTNFPFVVEEHYSLSNFRLLGYCNGLVCVRLNLDNICLWNPSTNEYKKLRELPLVIPIGCPGDENDYEIKDIDFGFGYDHKTGKFKVVSLSKYSHKDSGSLAYGSVVHLYTLGSDYWIRHGTIPYTVYGESEVTQVPVNGVIHWEVYRGKDGYEDFNEVILSFNFETEIFQEIPLLDLSSEDLRTDLRVLGGSLCIWVLNPDIGIVEVWELKECEARKSWNKVFTIDMKNHFGLVEDFVPLQSSKNGVYLFGCETAVGFHVHRYDSKLDTPRLFFVYEGAEDYCFSSTTVCVESLVSLTSGCYVDNNEDDAETDDGDECR